MPSSLALHLWPPEPMKGVPEPPQVAALISTGAGAADARGLHTAPVPAGGACEPGSMGKKWSVDEGTDGSGKQQRKQDIIVISSSDDEEKQRPNRQQYRQQYRLQQKWAGVGGSGKAATSGFWGAGIERVKGSRSAASDQGLAEIAIAIPTAGRLSIGTGAADARGLHTASVPAGAAVRLDHHAAGAAVSKGVAAPAITAAYGAMEAHIVEAAVAAPAEAEAAGGAGTTGTQEAPKQYILNVTDDVGEAAEEVLEMSRRLKVERVEGQTCSGLVRSLLQILIMHA